MEDTWLRTCCSFAELISSRRLRTTRGRAGGHPGFVSGLNESRARWLLRDIPAYGRGADLSRECVFSTPSICGKVERSLRRQPQGRSSHLDENRFRPGSFNLFLGRHPRSPERFELRAGHHYEGGTTIRRWLMASGYSVRLAWTLIKPGRFSRDHSSATQVADVAVMAPHEGDRSDLDDSNHTSG